MKFSRTATFFFTAITVLSLTTIFSNCIKAESTNGKQIIVEEYAKEKGYTVEVCPRCGYTSVHTGSGDILLIHWDSPYVDYQNKKGRIKLNSKNRHENGQTYTEERIFEE